MERAFGVSTFPHRFPMNHGEPELRTESQKHRIEEEVTSLGYEEKGPGRRKLKYDVRLYAPTYGYSLYTHIGNTEQIKRNKRLSSCF